MSAYACPVCRYVGPAERRDFFPAGSIYATESWPVCFDCGFELTRHDRLHDDDQACEVCEHAVGQDGTSICHACRIADELDDLIVEQRRLRRITDQTVANIRSLTLLQAGAL